MFFNEIHRNFLPLKNTLCYIRKMTDEIVFKALTPEQRAAKEAEMDKYDAEQGICLSCGA